MNNECVNRHLLKHKVETLSEAEAAEVLEYIGIMEFLRDEPNDPLTETLAKLLCEAMIGAPQFGRNQIRRAPLKN